MDRLRITELFVENVGPFEYRHFIFPDKKKSDKAEIHLITGENGTGKSTLLIMLSSLLQNNQIYKRFQFENATSSFKIKFSNGQEFTIKPQTGGVDYSQMPRFLREYQQKIGNPNYSSFDFAFFAYSGYRQLTTHRLGGIQEITNNPFENALHFGGSTNPQLLIQWVANLKTKEALALAKHDKLKAANYKKSITRIETSISRIIDKPIEFILEEDPLNVVIKLDHKLLEFDLLPDGLKAIVSWISDLLMRLDRIKWNEETELLERNFILFLDEIDVHLHPAWQRKILPVIQDLFKNAQIFVTTHSPFVVGSTDGAWIHKLGFNSDKNSKNIEPFLSEDSKSYTLVLNEIFNIHNYFGIELEKQLEEFRKLRNQIVHSNTLAEKDLERLRDIIKYFKEQKSIELDNMIGMELLQLKKILKLEDLLND